MNLSRTDLPDLAGGVLAYKEKRIKTYPHPNNRASEIGHPCLRYLILARTAWEQKKPHDVTLQCIFDMGNGIERDTLRDLQDSGFEIVEQQRSFEWTEFKLTGHLDAMVKVQGVTLPVEVKGLAHYTWEKLNTFSDFLTSDKPWIQKYPGQLTAYMLMSNKEWGCFHIVSKQTGVPKSIWIELDYDYAEGLLKKLEIVNRHVDAGTLPVQDDSLDPEACIDCDFFHVCLPEITREAIHLSDDPELTDKVSRYFELKPLKAEYDALDKQIKRQVEGTEKAIIGDYLVLGKWVDRKGYIVEDGRYWKKSIKRLTD